MYIVCTVNIYSIGRINYAGDGRNAFFFWGGGARGGMTIYLQYEEWTFNCAHLNLYLFTMLFTLLYTITGVHQPVWCRSYRTNSPPLWPVCYWTSASTRSLLWSLSQRFINMYWHICCHGNSYWPHLGIHQQRYKRKTRFL